MQNRVAVLILLIISFTAISSSITYYLLSPRPSQPYMTLALYSQSGLQGYASPQTNSTVTPQQRLNWTLAVSNRMGTSQFAMVIARIANSTLASPSTTTPSTWFPEIVTPTQFISDGATEYLNFTWNVQNVTQISKTQGTDYDLGLAVNGQTAFSAPVEAFAGQGFRWIFELWTYDLSCGTPLSNGCFHYGYGPQSSPTGEWLQIWFNAHP